MKAATSWVDRGANRCEPHFGFSTLIPLLEAREVLTEEELPIVSAEAHAVIEEAKAAGAYVFGGVIEEAVATVIVSADRSECSSSTRARATSAWRSGWQTRARIVFSVALPRAQRTGASLVWGANNSLARGTPLTVSASVVWGAIEPRAAAQRFGGSGTLVGPMGTRPQLRYSQQNPAFFSAIWARRRSRRRSSSEAG